METVNHSDVDAVNDDDNLMTESDIDNEIAPVYVSEDDSVVMAEEWVTPKNVTSAVWKHFKVCNGDKNKRNVCIAIRC